MAVTGAMTTMAPAGTSVVCGPGASTGAALVSDARVDARKDPWLLYEGGEAWRVPNYLDALKALGAGPATKFVIPMEFTQLLKPFGTYLEKGMNPNGSSLEQPSAKV